MTTRVQYVVVVDQFTSVYLFTPTLARFDGKDIYHIIDNYQIDNIVVGIISLVPVLLFSTEKSAELVPGLFDHYFLYFVARCL